MNDDPSSRESAPTDRDVSLPARDAAHEEDLEREAEGSEFAESADAGDETEGPIDTDLPCIGCEYNLRGLQSNGVCPECGTHVRRSIHYATQELLCVACMRPNHPTAAVCAHCGAPTRGAGANASYWQTTPIGVRTKKPVADDIDEPSRPSITGVVIAMILFLPVAFAMGTKVVEILDNDPGSFIYGGVLGMTSLGLFVLALLPLGKYFNRRREFFEWEAKSKRGASDKAPPSDPDQGKIGAEETRDDERDD